MAAAKYRGLRALCILLLTVTGCAGTAAPPGWLPGPAETQTEAYGGWVEIELMYPTRHGDVSLQGEVTRQRARLRESYDQKSPLVARLVPGTVVFVLEERAHAYLVDVAHVGRGWISKDDMVLKTSDDKLRGELVAVSEDSLYILGRSGFAAVAIASIEKGIVTAYDSGAGTLAAWTVAGVASTLSHGFGLVLSMPVWIIVGSVTTGQEARSSSHRTRQSWRELRKFARFPQGLPPNLDRSTLKPHLTERP